MDTRVKGLSGSKKRMWLRLNYAEVFSDYERYGREYTMQKYNLKSATLESFLSPSFNLNTVKYTKADRAIDRSEIVEEGVRQLRREVRDLRDQWGKFVPMLATQLTNKFFIPLISGKIELPPELEQKPEADPLALSDFLNEWEK